MANNFSSRKHGYGNFSHDNRGRSVPGAQRAPRDRARRTSAAELSVDPAAIDRLVTAAAPAADGLVLVPAAGDGALVRALAAQGARVTVYEADPAAAGRLAARTRDEAGISVVRADFTRARAPREPFALVALAPDPAAAASLTAWCLRAPAALSSATLLVPREYAEGYADAYAREHGARHAQEPDRRPEFGVSVHPAGLPGRAILRLDRR
ncbi:rRNA adenine N-6-methyltransferase family protein [Streptomyces sp. SBR177]